MKKFLILIILSVSGNAFSCPGGQHNECTLPSPWGCKAKICVPNVHIDVPEVHLSIPNIGLIIQDRAYDIAEEGHSTLAFTNHDGCMLFVTGGLTAWGASIGGPVGAAVGGVMGLGASMLACNKWYPSN